MAGQGSDPGAKRGGRTGLLDRSITRRDFVNGVLVGSAGLASGSLFGFPLSGCNKNKDSETGGGAETGEMGYPSIDGGDDYSICHSICHSVWQGQTWDIPDATGDVVDCVIIGGGLSGLVAAWQLGKKGYSVFLLEKGDEVGGQCRKDASEPNPASVASAFTDYPYNKQLTELYTDLGIVTGTTEQGYPVIDEQYLVMPPYDCHYIDGAWYDNPLAARRRCRRYPIPTRSRRISPTSCET